MTGFEEKHAIVCGSSRGIGKAIAIEFAQRGATVTLIARDESELLKVKNILSTDYDQAHSVLTVDFNRPEYLEKLINNYLNDTLPIHILVNNTGGPPGGPIHQAQCDEFSQAFKQHLICNHILTQALLSEMKSAGYGRIINIISRSVKQPLTDLGVSNTIRAAVANWAKTLATELGPFGITVNNILPGATKTGRLQEIIAAKAKRRGQSIETIKGKMLAEIPVRRFAEPAEIAAGAVFLASPAASYITGINLTIDGGQTGCL